MNVIAVAMFLLSALLDTALSKWSCGDVQPPTNGKLTVVSYRLLAKNTAIFAFSCKPGYTLKGPMCALCVDGVIRRMPKCVEIYSCPALDAQLRRDMARPTWQQLFIEDYEVDPEKLFLMLLAVMNNGKGATSAAARGRLLFEIKSILEVVGKINDRKKAEFGDFMTRTSSLAPLYSFKCNGAHSPDSPVFQKYCFQGKTLPSFSPSCVQAPVCPELNPPANGSVNIFKPNKSLQTNVTGIVIASSGTAVFSCNRGFALRPPDRKFVTCGNDGRWSAETPECLFTCRKADPPENGIIEWQGGYFRVSCNKGFRLYGSSKIYCNSDGTWSGGDSLCVEANKRTKRCKLLTSSDDKSPEKIKPNRMQMFSAYKKSRTNLTWHSREAETCTDFLPCPLPEKPAFGKYTALGNISISQPLSRLHYACNSGYVLRGKDTVLCTLGGKWSAPAPVCRRRPRCPAIYPIRNGGANWAGSAGPFLYLSAVIFYCNPGYTMKGTPLVLCKNGAWIGRIPVCEESCGPSITFPNGLVTFPVQFGFSPGRFARFDCDEGFVLSGPRFVMCKNQSWLTPLPKCEARTPCPTIEAPANGSVTLQLIATNPRITSAQFTCNEGFTLHGNERISCSENDGRWSYNSPRCDETLVCPSILQPTNGRFRFLGPERPDSLIPGTVITFTCDPGFLMQGEVTIRCNVNGTWSGVTPKCVEDFGGRFVIPEGPIGTRG